MNSDTKPSHKSYTVYWAKHAHFSKVETEGYVGITSNSLDDRKKSHFKEARSSNRPNVHFHNVLKKYGTDIVWEVLHENLSEEEAFAREAQYRPSVHIGWNSDRGGVKAISAEWYADEKNKEEHRLRTAAATKARIAEKDTPEARSERAKEVWSNPEYKKSRAGEISGEKNPAFGLFGTSHPAAGHKKTEAGLKAISQANKGKKLTEAQKKAISDARSSKIGVFDKDRETMYKRRMAGESVASISLSYPITQSSVDRNIRKWWKKNKLPRPSKLIEKPPVREQNPEKKKLSKKLQINKSKIAERNILHQQNKAQAKILKHFENALHIEKRQIFKEIRSAKKETTLLFKKIQLQMNAKIQINKNELKFYERILKETKHIIDRKTGKFQGQNARASKFTDAERASICRRRIDGETYAKIGKTYGKGVSTIKNICQNWGPKNNYPFEAKIGKSDLKKVTSSKIKTAICKEYSEGVSAMTLATKYELSFQTVYTFLADWGPRNNIPYVKHKTD